MKFLKLKEDLKQSLKNKILLKIIINYKKGYDIDEFEKNMRHLKSGNHDSDDRIIKKRRINK